MSPTFNATLPSGTFYTTLTETTIEQPFELRNNLSVQPATSGPTDGAHSFPPTIHGAATRGHSGSAPHQTQVRVIHDLGLSTLMSLRLGNAYCRPFQTPLYRSVAREHSVDPIRSPQRPSCSRGSGNPICSSINPGKRLPTCPKTASHIDGKP